MGLATGRLNSWAVIALSAALSAVATAESVSPAPTATDQLSEMSLEDLMNIEVTSVSRYRQKASQAPAAVAVITQDDISRSGLHSIPELLRLSAGMSVARIDANDWAISARGFNDKYANKLLILVDGRTVYSPLFAGVAWDQQGYPLQDLERIEVIRGPGATMWGSNAVNGVINITTKNARDTQGVLIDGLAGNVDSQATIRYGGRIDTDTYYRLFGMFTRNGNFVDASGQDQFDGWQSSRGGFRMDHFGSSGDTLTLMGEVHQNLFAEFSSLPSLSPPFSQEMTGTHYGGGQHILGRWTHNFAEDSECSLQLYYDRFWRKQHVLSSYVQDTFDAEFQHRFPLGRRQSIIWGLGARYLIDSTESSSVIEFDPEDRDDYRLSAFVQDELAIWPERLQLIVGSKFEYSSYSDFEYQPSVRLLWTPSERHTVWAAVSRALHTPTRAEQDARVLLAGFPGAGGLPTGLLSIGNKDQASEELIAYELGWRLKPVEQLSVDLAAFFNHYENLRSAESGSPIFEPLPSPRVIIPLTTDSNFNADSYGLELSMNFNLSENCRLAASYSLVEIHAYTRGLSTDTTTAPLLEGFSPRNQAQVHCYYRLTRALELNGSAYYVESLPGPGVPGYVRVDLGASWRLNSGMALRVGVQNLLDDRHPEFGSQGAIYGVADEVPRAVYVQASWRF